MLNLPLFSFRYVVHIPDNLPLSAAAPLLCAGITVYSPMKHHNMLQAGKKLGVVGLGGLGHVAVKFGKAFGLHVTVISTSTSKEREAKERLSADRFIVSTDPKQMQVIILFTSICQGKFYGSNLRRLYFFNNSAF
jgi:cinnamyl-alcohol dehydrogenase